MEPTILVGSYPTGPTTLQVQITQTLTHCLPSLGPRILFVIPSGLVLHDACLDELSHERNGERFVHRKMNG